MGVTKKATIVAKTATKKRGRPAGSKNKATLLSSAGWVPPNVDWERLSKQLQQALAAQIKETDSYKKLFEDMEKNSKPVSLLNFWQRVKLVLTGSY
jgi:hypothetical protein